jgi:hypothetical protein
MHAAIPNFITAPSKPIVHPLTLRVIFKWTALICASRVLAAPNVTPLQFAVILAAGVAPALLVHRLDVRLRLALLPEGDAGVSVVEARVVAPL